MKTAELRRRIIVGIWAIFALLPVYWMFNLSFQKSISFPPKMIPWPVNIQNYLQLLANPIIPISLVNSIMVATIGGVLNIGIAALAGYAFSRLEFKGKLFLFTLVLITFLMPPHINVIPLYLLYSKLGLLDSLFGITILMQITILPLNIFLFMNYFGTIPDSILDSAKIDGCGHLRIFSNIVLPMSKPALIAAFIFAFRFIWSDYVFPVTFLSSPDKLLYTAGLSRATTLEYGMNYKLAVAGSMILLIPTLLIVIFGQRYLREGFKVRG